MLSESAFRRPRGAEKLLAAIREMDLPETRLMEVCGTHTMAIAKSGLRQVLPGNIRLL
ncbi:MAG: hydrogenase formation protein HypD, partial [Oscillospiraceae bacterium]|nr:hydrogenase formation protein HypD [Oscillospiraceae bacterium]